MRDTNEMMFAKAVVLFMLIWSKETKADGKGQCFHEDVMNGLKMAG